MRYAIQHKLYGQVIDYCDTKEQAAFFLNNYPVELVDTDNSTKIEVIYTELGGPSGYGHQEPSFTTYGGLKRCVYNLYRWIQNSARVFGPDARDVRDYLRHCSLYINGENKTEWLTKQISMISTRTIFA